MSIPTYHIWHDTAEGRLPFTYLVFGPCRDDFLYDVEVYKGHVEYPVEDRTFDQYGEILPDSAYIGTVSDMPRDTHIVIDVWDWMDANV
jgi:hypothetical protein